MSHSNRIEWVDFAKGLAIILMVMGHEIKNQWMYTIIFSFHMPLFFILSGYTSRRVDTFKRFQTKFKKSFTHVWMLAVLMILILGLQYKFFFRNFNFKYQVVSGIFCGSNIYKLGVLCVGVMWFLFVFFWAKMLLDIMQVVFDDTFIGIFLVLVAGISMYFCNGFSHWLPQALDIVPIAALFMWCGSIARKYQNQNTFNARWFQFFNTFILIFWVACICFKLHIELATRTYPLGYLSFFEALAGTYVVCLLCSYVVKLRTLKFIKICGKHTLAILCIHHLDLYWVIWSHFIKFWPVAMILRVLLDAFILIVFLYCRQKLEPVLMSKQN